MVYIDCDGVILDTENGLFDMYNELKKDNPDLTKRKYLENLDWYNWIRKKRIINDAINVLCKIDSKEYTILTKIHSLNEGIVKIEYLHELGIRANIILVPDYFEKCDIIDPRGNTLIDDSIRNLELWSQKKGIPIFFSDRNIKDERYLSISNLKETLISEE